ncbi:hypothetical protein QOT17_012646 [Balamuthia mandrillaris]
MQRFPLKPLRWDPLSSRWLPITSSSSPPSLPASSTTSLRVFTMNIWIYEKYRQQRVHTLVRDILQGEQVDVLCIQENTPAAMACFQECDYIREHFYLSPLDQQMSTYKTSIFSRIPFHSLECLQMPFSERKVILATFRVRPSSSVSSTSKEAGNGEEEEDEKERVVAVATCHLQSEHTAQLMRAKQFEWIASCMQGLRPTCDASLIVGDYNFHSDEEDEVFLREDTHRLNGIPIGPYHYLDAWKELHPNDRGPTYGLYHRLDRVCFQNHPNNEEEGDKGCLKLKEIRILPSLQTLKTVRIEPQDVLPSQKKNQPKAGSLAEQMARKAEERKRRMSNSNEKSTDGGEMVRISDHRGLLSIFEWK